jgi:dipeptidyl aminopeptidase/acylaminoacyl peptidase
MIPTRRGIVFAAVVLIVSASRAQAPQRTHDITVEDYFTLNLLTDCATAPDGSSVAYTELRWGQRDESRATHLWLVDTATQRPQRLTFEPVNHESPQFSPDSQRVYFTTRRKHADTKRPPYDNTRQVWVMTAQSQEPFPVTRVKGGIEAYQLSRDGRTLYYTKEGEEAERDWTALRKRFSEIKFGHGPVKYTELWRLDLESWREAKLASPQRVILEFEVAPDDSRVALVTTPDDRLITKEGQSRVDMLDLKTRQITPLPDKLYRADAPSPYGWVGNLAWSSDSRALAWTVEYDGYPTEILVAELTAESAHVWRLKRPEDVHVAGRLRWRPGTAELCFLGDHHAREQIWGIADVRAGRQGAARLLTPGDVVVQLYSFSADGNQLTFLLADPQNIGDLYTVDPRQPAGPRARLTTVNPQVDTWKLPQLSLVNWKASDGVEVEGVLELPPDYTPDQGPLPLAVELHGGPTDATRFYLRYWIYGRTLFPAKGYALLSPNYRGSTGYGDKFLTALVGHENDLEVKDILAGVDAMIERGVADPERMGIMGWSNGGFLVNCLITTTQRFKAASAGAGVFDQLMQWGLEDTPGHVINYMRGLPWAREEAYIKASPAYKLGAVTTPTLIHVGDKDERVPAAHSRSLYRGLKEYADVPTVLLSYPGAGHGLTVYDQRKAKMEWDLAWFDRYVLGEGEQEAEKEVGE